MKQSVGVGSPRTAAAVVRRRVVSVCFVEHLGYEDLMMRFESGGGAFERHDLFIPSEAFF